MKRQANYYFYLKISCWLTIYLVFTTHQILLNFQIVQVVKNQENLIILNEIGANEFLIWQIETIRIIKKNMHVNLLGGYFGHNRMY